MKLNYLTFQHFDCHSCRTIFTIYTLGISHDDNTKSSFSKSLAHLKSAIKNNFIVKHFSFSLITEPLLTNKAFLTSLLRFPRFCPMGGHIRTWRWSLRTVCVADWSVRCGPVEQSVPVPPGLSCWGSKSHSVKTTLQVKIGDWPQIYKITMISIIRQLFIKIKRTNSYHLHSSFYI